MRGPPLRICFVVSRFPTVSETFVSNQVAGLLSLGHDVSVLSDRPGDWTCDPALAGLGLERRVTFVHHGAAPASASSDPAGELSAEDAAPAARAWRSLAPRLPAALSIPRYARALGFRLRRFDVVHAHFGPSGLRALMLRRAGLLRGALVTTMQGYDMGRFVREHGPDVYRGLFRDGDLFLPVGEHGRERLVALGCPPSRIVVHRMGIDLARFRFSPREPTADGVVRLLSVARLVEKKGIDLVLRALAVLGAAAPPVRYEVVGAGPLRESLEAESRRLGLDGVVEFRGALPHPEVAEAIRRAHLFVLPSRTASDGDEEGIPVALMEAMASGTPVLSTAHAGIPELVRDGETGVLVPEGDEGALSAALTALITHAERWPVLGRAARARIEAEFDVAALNLRLAELYRGVAAGLAPAEAGS